MIHFCFNWLGRVGDDFDETRAVPLLVCVVECFRHTLLPLLPVIVSTLASFSSVMARGDLRKLNIQYNKITRIAPAISQLTSLRVLLASHNRIEVIAPQVCACLCVRAHV